MEGDAGPWRQYGQSTSSGRFAPHDQGWEGHASNEPKVIGSQGCDGSNYFRHAQLSNAAPETTYSIPPKTTCPRDLSLDPSQALPSLRILLPELPYSQQSPPAYLGYLPPPSHPGIDPKFAQANKSRDGDDDGDNDDDDGVSSRPGAGARRRVQKRRSAHLLDILRSTL